MSAGLVRRQFDHREHTRDDQDPKAARHPGLLALGRSMLLSNNSLISAAKDIGQRMSVTVWRYDFSESQYRKDVRSNLMSNEDMHLTILQRRAWYPDSGKHEKDSFRETSKRYIRMFLRRYETKKTLDVNKIGSFSKLLNIHFEENGISVWKSYGVGRGK